MTTEPGHLGSPTVLPGTECEACDNDAVVYRWTDDLGGFWVPFCEPCDLFLTKARTDA